MKAATYTCRGTKHPGDLHEFLDRALLEQTEAQQILASSPLIPLNTLNLPSGRRSYAGASSRERADERPQYWPR